MACTSALGLFIAAEQHALASTAHPEWGLAQRCHLTSVPGPAERVTGVSLCHELFQTFALGKGPFSISGFV